MGINKEKKNNIVYPPNSKDRGYKKFNSEISENLNRNMLNIFPPEWIIETRVARKQLFHENIIMLKIIEKLNDIVKQYKEDITNLDDINDGKYYILQGKIRGMEKVLNIFNYLEKDETNKINEVIREINNKKGEGE